MPTVAVDLDDLETLVLSTGALKTIEAALHTRQNDPFVRPHLDFTAAHDRLASEMRNARRSEAGTFVGWDDPLTDQEIKELDTYDCSLPIIIPPRSKLPQPGESMSVIDRLAAKGCVQIGQLIRGTLWSENDTAFTIDATRYAVRITQRGRNKLDQAKKAA